MSKNRVVVTGIGLISALGTSIEEFFGNLLQGKSGVSTISNFDITNFEVKIGGEIKGFDPGQYIDPKEAKRQDRFTQLAVAAGSICLKDSAINLDQVDRARIGVVMGSGIGGLTELQTQHEVLMTKGPSRVSPFFVPRLMINAAPGQMAIQFGLRGPNFSTSSACASANHAMGMALRLLQYGEADAILTGGSEAALTTLGLAGFTSIKALSHRNDAPEKASRPFEKNRDGFVLAEGSTVLMFESLEHAKKRGAKIYGEVLGFGQSDDAHHITAPDPDGTGAAAAMAGAIQNAGLTPDQISYVNAHGTSTPLNDKVETLALKKVFGDRAKKVPVSSTKSMTGHLLGAAAAIELAATLMSCKTNRIHPTINYETPDPECDLDYTPNKMRELEVQYALSNSLGFGGHNSAVVVGKFKG
jgi:3-oxoacyl-[acyl-carrier-protein] synthase II